MAETIPNAGAAGSVKPADVLTIGVFGIRWRIDLSVLFPGNAGLAATLRHLWARAAVQPDGSELPFAVALSARDIQVDANGIPRGAVLGAADRFPYVLSRAVTMASISVRRGSALMLHAAGLAVPAPDGATRALVLVAPSGTGKSTAVRALGREWGYLSDESVVIEPDMTISPYPKPISLKTPDRPGDKDEFSPDDLGLAAAPERCPVGAVVVLVRDDGIPAPSLEPLSVMDALLAVLPQTSSPQVLDRPLHRLAEVLSAGPGPHRLTYRHIDQCADVLAALAVDRRASSSPWLAGSIPAPRGAASVADSTSPRGGVALDADGGRVVRADCTDALDIDDEVLVLVDTLPVRLSGIGATIWRAAREPVTVLELERIVVAHHGSHVEQRAKVAEAVQQLRSAGVLAVSAEGATVGADLA